MKHLPFLLAFTAGGLAGWLNPGNPPSAVAPGPTAPRSASPVRRVVRAPEEFRSRVETVSQAGSRAEQMRRLLELAVGIPLSEIPRWFESDCLGFLDESSKSLFYDLLLERWVESDPSSAVPWFLDHDQSRGAEAIRQWMWQDETSALAFYRALPAVKRGKVAGEVIRVVGESDVPAALSMLGDLDLSEISSGYPLLGLVRRDRDAVCAYARQAGPVMRKGLLYTAAGAWLDKDLPWVITMMEREGLGPESFYNIFNQGYNRQGGRCLLRQAAALPEGWLDRMSRCQNSTATYECELDWLRLRGPSPGIDENVLRRLQAVAASNFWCWDKDKHTAAMELLGEADWLAPETRSALARSLVNAWWKDPEAARKWIDGLSGDIRNAAEKAFAAQAPTRDREKATQENSTPEKFIEALARSTSASPPPAGFDWSESAIEATTKLAASLDPAQASRFVTNLSPEFSHMPEAVTGAILSRALLATPAEEGAEGTTRRNLSKAVCQQAAFWARRDPAQAAAWVTTLPAGEPRAWAVRNVAIQWVRYSPADLRQWAQTLPEAEQKIALSYAREN